MQAPGQQSTAAMSPEAWFAAHLHSVSTGGAHGSYAGRPFVGSASTAMPGPLQAVQTSLSQQGRASVPASVRHAGGESLGSAAAPFSGAAGLNSAMHGGVADGGVGFADWAHQGSSSLPDVASRPGTAVDAPVWDAAPPAALSRAPPATHAAPPSSAQPAQAPLMAQAASSQAVGDVAAAAGTLGAANAGPAAGSSGAGHRDWCGHW